VLQVKLARYWTGDMYFKVGNIAVATEKDEYSTFYYQKAVEMAPEREIYWVKYGIGYEKIMRKEQNLQDKKKYVNEALKIHNKTIKMNDRNGYNYNNAARVYKFFGETIDRSGYEQAVKFYLEAIKRDPNNAYFGLDLASVYINMQEWQKAEELCKRYVQLYPEYAVPLSYLGYINMLQGKDRINEAKYFYEQAVSKTQWHNDMSTKASTYSNLGIIYFNLKMVNEAVSMFNEVVKARPDYMDGYLNLGKLYELMKNKPQAIEMYETALKLNPADERALVALKNLGAR
jgi:protein O-GlcNAc transferase